MATSKLRKPEVLSAILKWRYQKLSYSQIIEKLKENFDLITTPSALSYLFKSVGEDLQTESVNTAPTKSYKTEQEQIDIQNYLYNNRYEIVNCKNVKNMSLDAIADHFSVSKEDIQLFFEQRKFLNPEQIKEMVALIDGGMNKKEVAAKFGVNANMVNSLYYKEKKLAETKEKLKEQKKSTERVVHKDSNSPKIPTPAQIPNNPAVIKEFSNFIQWVQTQYANAENQKTALEHTITNILHELELMDLAQERQLELATSLAKATQERRQCKDFIEDTKDLVELLEKPEIKACVATLSNVACRIVNNMTMRKERVYEVRKETPKTESNEIVKVKITI